MPPRRKNDDTSQSAALDIDVTIPEISIKSTKQEQLDAYQQLVARLGQQDADAPPSKHEAEKRRQDTVVAATRGVTVNTIVASIGTLKVDLATVLNNVSQKLVEQVEKFRQLEEATLIQTKRIAELHDIELAADTLALTVKRHSDAEAEFDARVAAKRAEVEALLYDAKETAQAQIDAARAAFDAEMGERRAAWQREQAEHEALVAERNERVRRGQERELEEYAYQLKLSRERDSDAYEATRRALDAELTALRQQTERDIHAREVALKAQEEHLRALRERSEAFPLELQKAVEQAREQGRKEAEHNRERFPRPKRPRNCWRAPTLAAPD